MHPGTATVILSLLIVLGVVLPVILTTKSITLSPVTTPTKFPSNLPTSSPSNLPTKNPTLDPTPGSSICDTPGFFDGKTCGYASYKVTGGASLSCMAPNQYGWSTGPVANSVYTSGVFHYLGSVSPNCNTGSSLTNKDYATIVYVDGCLKVSFRLTEIWQMTKLGVYIGSTQYPNNNPATPASEYTYYKDYCYDIPGQTQQCSAKEYEATLTPEGLITTDVISLNGLTGDQYVIIWMEACFLT